MKQILHILFLGISVLFSFGMTSFKSACSVKDEVIDTIHSCCQVKTEVQEVHSHVAGDCCGTDICKGNCCVEAVDYFQFTDFIFQIKSVDINELAVTYVPNFLINLIQIEVNQFQYKLIVPPDLGVGQSSSKYIRFKTQSWLI